MIYYRNIKGKNFPFSDLHQHDKHEARLNREYTQQKDIDRFYFRAFAMLRMNKVAGDYLEFGSGSTIRSFRFALKYNRLEAYEQRMLYSFDSFAGLPEPKDIDAHPQWQKGSMAVTLEQFRAVLAHYGAKEERDYKTVSGFYDDTLVGHEPSEYNIEKAAFVHIDCDLYSSTKPVLEFVTPLLQDGAVLSFDDWYCFNANPELGEQKAFHEWRKAEGAALTVTPYLPFGWHGMSFIVNRSISD